MTENTQEDNIQQEKLSISLQHTQYSESRMEQSIQQEKNFLCSVHPECEKQAICLSEKKEPFKSRFICIKCVLQCKDLDIQSKIFFIQDLIKQPKTVIETVTTNQKIPVKKDFFERLKDLKDYFLEFQGLLNNRLLSLQQEYDQMNDNINITLEKIENSMKLEQFKQYFDIASKKDSHDNFECNKIEEFAQKLSTDLNKTFYNEFDIGKAEALEKIIAKIIDNLKEDIQTFSNNSLRRLNQITEKLKQSLENEDINAFPELHEKISQGKNVKYELIYQGTRDGMSAANYWQKCNLQDHLLTIMESKNNTKFGGYSPLQLNSAYQNWLVDSSLQSFLFSYTKRQIYKQVKKNNTIYCHPNNGPYFGELAITSSDFQTGNCSNLGTIFDASNYVQTDKSQHLFGGKQPQLVEIKVYKVIFD